MVINNLNINDFLK